MPYAHFPAVSLSFPGHYLAGVDEVGRGPLVGSVVAAAVILDPQRPITGLKDSKKLSEKKRDALFTVIQHQALAYGIAEASAAEIDQMNILQASFLAMQRALLQLNPAADFALIDGNRVPPQCPCAAQALVKGDSQHPAIAAASILAKVTRDQAMYALAQQHPEYGFERHKGYPTKEHLAALQTYGALAQHRRSFAPVARVLTGSVR